MLPSTVVRGRASFEWLEGERFLIYRSSVDHPDFPTGLSVIGMTEGLSMHYFDSRGVHRIYGTSFQDGVWRIWRDAPEFSQRFAGRLGDDGDTLTGVFELSRDGSTWEKDMEITYRRAR